MNKLKFYLIGTSRVTLIQHNALKQDTRYLVADKLYQFSFYYKQVSSIRWIKHE